MKTRLAIVCVLVTLISASSSFGADKPNILVIMGDDIGVV